MLRNYFMVALRNLARNRVYVCINIVGLAVGIACCVLIGLYIYDEYRTDRFHSKADHIYRLVKEVQTEDNRTITPVTSGAFHRILKADFPEVETTTRCLNLEGTIQHKDQSALAPYVLVEPDFFDVFDIPLVRGTIKDVIEQPMSIILSAPLAKRLFGNQDPMGQTVTMTSGFYFKGDLVVRGVMPNISHASSLKYDMVVTGFKGQPIQKNKIWDNWTPTRNWPRVYNFVLLKPDASAKILETKLSETMPQYLGDAIAQTHTYHLQPLTRIYLHSKTDFRTNRMVAENNALTGDIRDLLILGAVACFILLIACINFMNLTTARSMRRAKEVGLRKVVGANHLQLIGQFLGEAFLMVGIACILSWAFIELAMPYFAPFMGKPHLSFGLLSPTHQILSLLITFLLVGLLAGAYPAFFLSAFRPIDTLKSTSSEGGRGTYLRKGLVVVQFALSVILIAGTVIVYQQIELIQSKRLNDQNPILTTNFFSIERGSNTNRKTWLQNRYQTVKQTLLKNPNILSITASQWPIGFNGAPKINGNQSLFANERKLENQSIGIWQVDEDYIPFYDLKIIAGRNFSLDTPTDAQQAFILNEAAVKMLGWQNPIGKQITWNRRKGQVVGVVEDYHISSLHFDITPLVLVLGQRASDNLVMKLRPNNVRETQAFIDQTLSKFAGRSVPAKYHFEDETLATIYRREMRIRTMTTAFSGLAIFLACLGLLGLTAYAAERRTKEIGIRKVLGASAGAVVVMLSKDFAKLILIANILAWPTIYIVMNHWLQEFAFRTTITLWPFILGTITTFTIALSTTSYQAIKAAQTNPINALRHE